MKMSAKDVDHVTQHHQRHIPIPHAQKNRTMMDNE